MSESNIPEWRYVKNIDDLNSLIELSNETPVILFRYNSDKNENHKIKKSLDKNWEIEKSIPAFLLDDSLVPDLTKNVIERLEIDDVSPIILLVTGGEVIYEESDEITAKKVQLAVRIVKRTFKWLESRKQKKAPGNPKA